MANRRFIDFPVATTVGANDIILIWQDGLNKQTTKATFLSGLPENLDELNDVAISGLTNGQILRYDSVTGKWENTDQGNLDLNDLNDVSIVSPSNGQVLVYNSSTSQWENSSGGYVPYVGAVTTVDLGAQQLKAGYTTLTTNGSTETLTINHTSGSGKAINVTKGGAGEGLYVNKTSGSGNAATIVGTLEATTLNKTAGTSTQFLKADGSVDSTTYQNTADKGQPNGYASLDGNGKVPLTQINDALIGNVNFQGLWNASTNTPTLVDPPSSGTKGYYYIVSTGGTFAGITFEVGDWIISNGTAWGKVDNTDAVSSVFGRTGNVTASNGDYNTSQVTESGNLYYTDARSRAALSFAAGSGAYNSGTGVITIPTDNNQITNGAGYITSAALANYLPLTGGTLTGALNGTSASFTGDVTASSNAFFGTFNGNNKYRFEPFTNAAGGANNAYFVSGKIDNNERSGFVFQARNSNGEEYNAVIVEGHNSTSTTTTLSIASTGAATFSSSVTANSFIKSGGTSSQYLMADGSVSTLSNPVTGTGTTNYLPKFTGSTTIGNSNIISDGSGKFSLGTAATHGNATFEQTTGEVGLVVNSSIAESPTIYLRDAGGAGYSTILANNNLYLNASRILVGTTSDNGAKLQVSGTATFSGNVVLGTTALSGGGAAQWLTANGTSYGGGLISSVSGVVKAYYYYDSSANAAMVQAVAGVGVQLWANATVALSIASTGAATFSGQLHIPNNSTGTGGGLYFDYNANAASRNWQIVSDYDVYGDFQIRQSTTQTGSTYSKILGFSPTGAATFSSSVTAGGNVNIYSSVIPSIVALTPTFWGYSSSYPVVMLGSSASASTVAIGYNPSGNANGSFTGNGDEILFRNGAKFTTPNSANNSFYLNHLVLKDGNVGIGTASPTSKLSVQEI
jgi:hypothetical protein